LIYKTEEQLKQLARDRALVSCQLLARQVPVISSIPMEDGSMAKKRPMLDVMPELAATKGVVRTMDRHHVHSQLPEVAICKITYRPTLFQFFATDVAQSLVANGNASVSLNILGRDESDGTHSRVMDCSERLHDHQNDIKYLERLTKVEFEAAAQSNGMWSVAEVREAKREVVDEVEFQANATTIRKLLRWMRGG
jgi:hypothetical protein